MDHRELRVGWRSLFGDIRPVPADARVTIRVEREVIPIIFVPGIMGSRLKRTRSGPMGVEPGKAWEPEFSLDWRTPLRGTSRARWFASRFLNQSAEYRMAQLIGEQHDPDYLEVLGRTPEGGVDDGDRRHAAGTEDVRGAFERGWVGISQDSYGAVLRELDGREWSEPVRHCFDLPVHAFGYNWSQSNVTSGEQLVDYAERVVRGYAAERECRRVVLVTHSMGGLVARAACRQLGGSDLVLGVVHGVQPAAGAANAYWRMKGGFAEFGISLALGKNAAEVTPLLGHMPGGLQLLPNKRYRALEGDGSESATWLRYPEPSFAPNAGGLVERPTTGDPYEEIYRERNQFYRLCDDRLLDPGGFVALDPTQTDPTQADPTQAGAASGGHVWDLYVAHIDEAERYHDLHDAYAHPDTVQFYADDVKTQTRIEYTRELDPDWDEEQGLVSRGLERVLHPIAGSADVAANTRGFSVRVTWNGLPIDDAMAFQPSGQWLDVAPGTYHDPVYVMALQPADGLGDGTVPQTSGRALELEDGRTVRIGADVEPTEKARGHEPVYNGRVAQHVTAMAIENLCLGLIRRETGGGGAGPPSGDGGPPGGSSGGPAAPGAPGSLGWADPTRPTGPMGGTPSGTPAALRPQDDVATRRSLQRENEAAQSLARAGYRVEQRPPPLANGKRPDYLVEGRVFDCYAPGGTTPPRNVYSVVERTKVATGQTDRIVLNLDDWGGDLGALRAQFAEWPMDGLNEVLVVRDGAVFPL